MSAWLRDGCPLCGGELRIPRHVNYTPWTKAQLTWVHKLLGAGVHTKQVARLMSVSVGAMHDALRKERSRS